MTVSSAPAPRRHPTAGGYARGEETREKIIEAALLVFGEEGYARASTRRIAARAGVNPPALQYYFDSKDGLHRACGQFIIDHVAKDLDPAMDQARRALADGGVDAATEALCVLIQTLAGLAIAKSGATRWGRFMARAQADDAGPAFLMTQEKISDPLRSVAIALVARSLGRAEENPDVRLRAAFLLSQLGALHVHGPSTLAMLNWPGFCRPAVRAGQARASRADPSCARAAACLDLTSQRVSQSVALERSSVSGLQGD